MTNYHATVDGNVPFTQEEEIEWAARNATYEKEQVKIKIKADIAALEETITPRRTREAILAIDTVWLADVELQIGQLRQQLAEL